MTPAERDALFNDNRRLAYWTARRVWALSAIRSRAEQAGHTFADAKQHSLLGLFRAAQHFDPARGSKFSSLAFLCCRQAIITGLKQHKGSRYHPPLYSLHTEDGDNDWIFEPVDHREPAPAELAEWREELATVLKAMRSLPPRARQALMRRAHGATYRGLLAGRSPERARQLVESARERLLRTLASTQRRAAA